MDRDAVSAPAALPLSRESMNSAFSFELHLDCTTGFQSVYFCKQTNVMIVAFFLSSSLSFYACHDDWRALLSWWWWLSLCFLLHRLYTHLWHTAASLQPNAMPADSCANAKSRWLWMAEFCNSINSFFPFLLTTIFLAHISLHLRYRYT